MIRVVSQRVVDQATEKRDVRAGADGHVEIGNRRRAVEPRIDGDELRLPRALGFHDEAETDGMVFSRVAAHDQHDVGVGDVGPAVCHGPAAKRGGQTGHRGAVSKPGLIFVGDERRGRSGTCRAGS